jgi:hypothetical protein
MIHRLTIPFRIRVDYSNRSVFSRYQGAQHIMMDDISVKVGDDDLREILKDAENNSTLRATGSPQLTIAYVRFAEKVRFLLRQSPENLDIGRDGKSAAAGD